MRRLLLVGLVVTIGLGVLAALLGPPLVEQAITARARAEAAERGVDLTWGALALDPGGATLSDVRLTHRRGRARIAEMRLDVSLVDAIVGDVRIERARIVEPEIVLEPPTESTARGGSNPSTERLSLGRLPPMLVESPRVTAHIAGRRLVATAERLSITPDENAVAVDGEGALHVDDTPLLVGTLTGRLEGSGRVQLAVIGEAEPALQITHRGTRISARAVALDGGLDRGRVTLRQVSAQRGPVAFDDGDLGLAWDREALELNVDGGTMRLDGAPGQASAVALRQLARGETTGIERLLSGATGADPNPASQHPERSDPLASIRARLGDRMDGLTIATRGLSVDLPGVPPVMEIEGRWRPGALHGRAVLAGGEVTAFAEWRPGHRRPDVIAMTADGVRLAPLFARRLPPGPPHRQSAPTRADGVLGGELRIAGLDGPIGRGPTLIDGELRWSEGRIELVGLSPDPVDGIELTVGGAITWRPDDDALRFEGRVAQGPLALVGEGRITDALGDPTVRLEARGEPIDCATAFDAVPDGVWGPYAGARLSGELAPRIRLMWPVHRPDALELKIRDLFKACAVETLAATRAPAAEVDGRPAPALDDVGWLDTRFVMPVREGTSEGVDVKIGPGAPGWVPLGELPRYVGAAMYQSEEMNFWRNNAIDRGLLVRALRINLTHGRFVYGGSTVTQQLVKNLFLTRHKSLARKLRELLVATRITQAIDRHRVLELYLNCIEFGPNVYGIGRAARYYFQKDARSLQPREAVFLAMLKPAPRRGAWYKRRGHSPTHTWWVGRAEELMSRLVDGGQISAATAAAQRPYGQRWIDGRYVGPFPTVDLTVDMPEPDAPTPEPPPPGGRRLQIGE